MDEILTKYFTLESYGIYNIGNENSDSILDTYSLKVFNEQHKIVNNRCLVPFLYKPDEEYPRVHSNLNCALNRHKALQNRLRKSATLAQMFNEKMGELDDKGVITKRGLLTDLWGSFNCEQKRYHENILLPIRLVIKEEKTTRMRLTLDCKMVNSLLITGKLLLRPIFDVFMEYRTAPFVASLDIKAMYYSIEYLGSPTIFQFLSQDPMKPNNPIEVWMFIRGVMGAKSTQFLALMCLQKIANLTETINPLVAKMIRSGYSDNLFVTAGSAAECNRLLMETIATLEKYHFTCHDIFCETKSVLKNIPIEKISQKMDHSLFSELYVNETQENNMVRGGTSCLGMKLCHSDSEESFIVYDNWIKLVEEKKSRPLTKRRIASTIAGCFSIHNMLCPITYYGKAVLNITWQMEK